MNCKICFEPFDHSIRKPYHLSCPHTFCISCLNDLKENNCPNCQKKITEKNPNVVLMEFIPESKYDKLKSETINVIIKLNETKHDFKRNLDTKLADHLKKLDLVKDIVKNETIKLMSLLKDNENVLLNQINEIQFELKSNLNASFLEHNDSFKIADDSKTLIETNKYNESELDIFKHKTIQIKERLDQLNEQIKKFNENYKFQPNEYLNESDLVGKLERNPYILPYDLIQLNLASKPAQKFDNRSSTHTNLNETSDLFQFLNTPHVFNPNPMPLQFLLNQSGSYLANNIYPQTNWFQNQPKSIQNLLNPQLNQLNNIQQQESQFNSTNNQPITSSSQISTIDMCKSFEETFFKILKPSRYKNMIILDKIEAEFNDQSKTLIRALVLAFCRSCLDFENKLNRTLFMDRSLILTQFINRNEEFETEALYAIQELDHRLNHQQGFIEEFFGIFYHEYIVNENALWIWKNNPDGDGHTISAFSLEGFYDWLSHTDESKSCEESLYKILELTGATPKVMVILNRIENEFNCQSKVFIRALVIAYCRSCWNSITEFNRTLFKNRKSILNRFINTKEFELEGLYAIQELDHRMQHQEGFIYNLFNIFYCEYVINIDSFWQWKNNAREDGHAISVLSLKRFYERLSLSQ